MKDINELKYALKFTTVYKEGIKLPKDIREGNCFSLQMEHVLAPISRDELIVGFMAHGYVGFSTQFGGIYVYYFHKDKVEASLLRISDKVDIIFIEEIRAMINFWEEEQTIKKLQNRFKDKYGYVLPGGYQMPGIANADGRIAGTNVDFDKLVKLGIPGLRSEIAEYENTYFYQGLNLFLDAFLKACDFYIENATSQLKVETEEKRKGELKDIIIILNSLKVRKPASFREGVQLVWLYCVITDTMNYGRMDVYLGDLYSKDIKDKYINEEDAIAYLSSLWRQFVKVSKIHDCRVIIGGVGRRNEINADALSIIIMEVSRRLQEVVPQLTLRYYSGMDEKVYDKALKMLGEGYCYPIIYSDDSNVPAVMKAYGVPREEAERYLPFGCGEYVLESLSTGTPNNGVNLLKALEITLHNGYDPIWKLQLEEAFGGIETLDTFDKLYNQYLKYVRRNAQLVADYKYMNYQVASENATFSHLSLLMDDCIKRGKPLLEGGVRYENAASEIFGMISCADSLTAIKKLVYEDKLFTLKEVVEMLDLDYLGFEIERKSFFNAPKYGNDNTYADEMALKVFTDMADITIAAGEKVGLNKYLMVSVNNSMSADWGIYCAASACGRKYKDPMANANGASLGGDKNGITALLNSMSKFDNTKHVGVINNVRLSKEMFTNSYGKVKAIFTTFFKNNGVQLNICCIGKDDLEKALLEPEKYKNLIIRVGGFSARFVELNSVVQNEIIKRTTYEG